MDALFPDRFLQQPQSEKFDTRLIVKIFPAGFVGIWEEMNDGGAEGGEGFKIVCESSKKSTLSGMSAAF